MDPKHTCPECNLIFAASMPESGLLRCPLCDTVFPERVWTPNPQVQNLDTRSDKSSLHVWKGCLAVAAVLFVVGGLVYAYRLTGWREQKPAHPTEPHAKADSPSVPEPLPLEIAPAPEPKPMPRPPELPKPPKVVAKVLPPLSLPERINRAIDRGVNFLRKNHAEREENRRCAGLIGLTLLECGVPANEPMVRQFAAKLRAQEETLINTYELTLAILFLDRLGEPRDRGVIRKFGNRLLSGQFDCGAWSYTCKDQSALPLAISNTPRMPRIISRSHSLPLNGRDRRRRPGYRGDNSNTQFAVLGLWVAQRHGVSARNALLAAEQYFRTTQLPDGSWGYRPNGAATRDSMTCAGLMSLAMRHGMSNGQGRDIRPNRAVPVNDPAIRKGLRFLDNSLDKIAVVGERISGADARDPLYFLWSLERMAVIYDRKKIGGKEWYPWAAEMLVRVQRPDGSWSAPYAGPVGTCFALLILKRSNLVHDLQLVVTDEPPPRSMPGISGPIILQGPEALLGSTTVLPQPKVMQGVSESGKPAAQPPK